MAADSKALKFLLKQKGLPVAVRELLSEIAKKPADRKLQSRYARVLEEDGHSFLAQYILLFSEQKVDLLTADLDGFWERTVPTPGNRGPFGTSWKIESRAHA